MTDPDSTYTPRSPNLSAFDNFPPPSHSPAYAQTHGQLAPPLFPQSGFDPQPQPQPAPIFYRDGNLPPPSLMAPRTRQKRQREDSEWLPEAPAAPEDSGYDGKAPEIPQSSVEGGVGRGIEVKTKFPVARIKRIMQADEDVGKVAQVTPVVVSKALELFMISLIGKASDEANARKAKRITAAHLKQAVAKDSQFDFLQEIVAKVPDAVAPAEKTEDGEGIGAKKKRAKGRKKKTDSEDDL